MKRTRYEASQDKRKAVENAEAKGVVSDSMDVRMELMKQVKNGDIALEEAQSELKRIKRVGNKQGLKTREQVYNPDILIIQDSTLLKTVDVTKGADENTKLIINTAKNAEDLKLDLPTENIFTIDATKIALDIIGKNLANTVILGAFAKATNLITLDGLKKAIKQKFHEKGSNVINKNIKAVETAYKNS
jgi:pyruvate ferredoxin oxidoreductase gamma subunit